MKAIVIMRSEVNENASKKIAGLQALKVYVKARRFFIFSLLAMLFGYISLFFSVVLAFVFYGVSVAMLLVGVYMYSLFEELYCVINDCSTVSKPIENVLFTLLLIIFANGVMFGLIMERAILILLGLNGFLSVFISDLLKSCADDVKKYLEEI